MAIDTETLLALIEGAGYEADTYSGRFMYGKQCVSVSLSEDETLLGFIADVVENAESDTVEFLPSAIKTAKTDSLGLGTVVYWPRCPWSADEAA